MSDTGVRIPSARSKKPFLTTKYRPQLLKKHLKKERLLSPLLLAAIRIWKQQPGLSGLPQRMVQISSNLAYRSLILPQKVPSFRVQI